ncbi:MAG TPA: right-handed parallel beta-helix repeat-containing protein, partial [Polyangiaceae bacterium]
PDGAIIDPDSGTIINPSDGGGASLSRVTCGSSYCRGDQTCNAGTCQYACTGTQVPGDYSTIQAAVNATINGGSDVTICLKAQAYTETVSISGSVTTPKKLTIQGVSAGSTTIGALTVSGSSAVSALSVRGVGFSSNVQLSNVSAPVELVGDKLAATSSYGLYDYGSSDVTVDGCDISSTSYYAVYFYAYYSGPAQKLTVRNSYIHDSNYGLYLTTGSYSGTGSGTVTMVNDTFNNNGYGIYTTGSGVATALTYANDLVVNSKTYGIDQESSSTTVTVKNNALFGNANNYAGSAVDGVGYVKADVKLDVSQSPPALGAGSPARGAADKTMAPGVDFWDVSRPSSPDIGAVQN